MENVNPSVSNYFPPVFAVKFVKNKWFLILIGLYHKFNSLSDLNKS